MSVAPARPVKALDWNLIAQPIAVREPNGLSSVKMATGREKQSRFAALFSNEC